MQKSSNGNGQIPGGARSDGAFFVVVVDQLFPSPRAHIRACLFFFRSAYLTSPDMRVPEQEWFLKCVSQGVIFVYKLKKTSKLKSYPHMYIMRFAPSSCLAFTAPENERGALGRPESRAHDIRAMMIYRYRRRRTHPRRRGQAQTPTPTSHRQYPDR